MVAYQNVKVSMYIEVGLKTRLMVIISNKSKARYFIEFLFKLVFKKNNPTVLISKKSVNDLNQAHI